MLGSRACCQTPLLKLVVRANTDHCACMGNPQGPELSFETSGIESGHAELLTMWLRTSCPVTVPVRVVLWISFSFPNCTPHRLWCIRSDSIFGRCMARHLARLTCCRTDSCCFYYAVLNANVLWYLPHTLLSPVTVNGSAALSKPSQVVIFPK